VKLARGRFSSTTKWCLCRRAVSPERKVVKGLEQLKSLLMASKVESVAIESARTRLSVLLGRGRTAKLVDIKDELRSDPETGQLEELFEVAKGLRPDLRALQREQASSMAEVRLRIAQGKVGYTVGTEYRRKQGLARTGNSLGLQIVLPMVREVLLAVQDVNVVSGGLRRREPCRGARALATGRFCCLRGFR